MLKKLILLCLFILCFCSKDDNIKLSDKLYSHLEDDNIELSGEIKMHLGRIKKIYIYSMDRTVYYLDLPPFHMDYPLFSERHIRQNGNIFIFDKHNGQQTDFIALLLYSAKRIIVDPKENVVQTAWRNHYTGIRTSGCVIDIYDEDNFLIKTYIMQNGLDIFYEKGKENVYYEMPKILLDKYIIYEQEFTQAYRENIRDERNNQ
jgi:hypothetical protein